MTGPGDAEIHELHYDHDAVRPDTVDFHAALSRTECQ